MRKLRIYLDTSAISFLFADDSPEKKEITIEFFCVHLNKYEAHISPLVIEELSKTADLALRQSLLEIPHKYPLHLLDDEAKSNEINDLAQYYLDVHAVSMRYRDDAMHVAMATVHEMDVLVSWNFKHLANMNKHFLFNGINRIRGYSKELLFTSPMEMNNENE